MTNELKFNGQKVNSITLTNSAEESGVHSNSMLINGHIIKGVSKDDCILEFENNRTKYDDCFRNSVEFFVVI